MRKLIVMNKAFFALLHLGLLSYALPAQETIYLEDFSTIVDGTGFPGALSDPTVIGQGTATLGTAILNNRFGRFSVNATDDQLESFSYSDGEVSWTTDIIDISCFRNIEVEMQFSTTENLETVASGMGAGADMVDYIAVDLTLVDTDETFSELFYRAGTSTTPLTLSTGSAILNTCFGFDIIQEIRLTVRFKSDRNFEGHNLRYIEVTGESTIPDNITYELNCDAGLDLQVGAGSSCSPQFSLDGVNYNDDGFFDNLTANTAYTIYIRDEFFVDCQQIFDVFVTDCEVVLPIELLRFSGQPEGDQVRLLWETATEVNNDYMAVEHSTDGVSFREIGRVRGAGTTDVAQQYQFLDRSPQTGNNYYRLRQVDFDGTTTYHQVIVVELTERIRSLPMLRLYPTAITDRVRIELGFEPGRDVSYRIYTITGEIVQSGQINVGIRQLELPVGHLAAGAYIFRLINGSERYSSRFFRQ